MKDGNIVNAKEFFEKNLAERINYGPGRKGNPALQNKDLAKLFNTNVRKIEETVKKIKNNPNFKADYPPKKKPNYGNKEATIRQKGGGEKGKETVKESLNMEISKLL